MTMIKFNDKMLDNMSLAVKENVNLLVAEGAIRSSKTVTMIQAFNTAVRMNAGNLHFIAAKDLDAVRDNILHSDGLGLLDMFPDIQMEKEPIGGYYITIPGFDGRVKKVLLVGYSKKDQWKKILGKTIGVELIDEVNLASEQFLDEAFARQASSDNPLTIYTLNGDDPKHYCYTKYINYCKPLGKVPSSILSDMNKVPNIVVPLGADGKAFINEFNAELRVEPIIKSLVSAMNVAARLCGLGDSSFEIGDNGGRPIQTATAAILKESKLYKNIIKQENLATAKIKALLLAIKEVHNTYISETPIEFEEDDIQVVYDDNIMEDTQQKKDNQLKEVTAGIMSIAEYRANWYDEDYDSALKFVQENGLLLDKYTLALQSKVITPEMFVELVFGENYKYKDQLVTYITENLKAPTLDTGFEDEDDNEDKGDEDDE